MIPRPFSGTSLDCCRSTLFSLLEFVLKFGHQSEFASRLVKNLYVRIILGMINDFLIARK